MPKKTNKVVDPSAKAVKLSLQAAKRVSRAIRSLNSVGLLGKYDPSKEQCLRIMTAINAAAVKVQDQLEAGSKKQRVLFQL